MDDSDDDQMNLDTRDELPRPPKHNIDTDSDNSLNESAVKKGKETKFDSSDDESSPAVPAEIPIKDDVRNIIRNQSFQTQEAFFDAIKSTRENSNEIMRNVPRNVLDDDAIESVRTVENLAELVEWRDNLLGAVQEGRNSKQKEKAKKTKLGINRAFTAIRNFFVDIPICEDEVLKDAFITTGAKNALAEFGEYLAEEGISYETIKKPKNKRACCETMLDVIRTLDITNVYLNMLMTVRQEWHSYPSWDAEVDTILESSANPDKQRSNYRKAMTYLMAQPVEEKDYIEKLDDGDFRTAMKAALKWNSDSPLDIIDKLLAKLKSQTMDIDEKSQKQTLEVSESEEEDLSPIDPKIPLRKEVAKRLEGKPALTSVKDFMEVITPKKGSGQDSRQQPNLDSLNALIKSPLAPMSLNEAVKDISTFADYKYWMIDSNFPQTRSLEKAAKIKKSKEKAEYFMNTVRKLCFRFPSIEYFKKLGKFTKNLEQTILADFDEYLVLNNKSFEEIKNDKKICADQILDMLADPDYAKSATHKSTVLKIAPAIYPHGDWNEKFSEIAKKYANPSTYITIYNAVITYLMSRPEIPEDQYTKALQTRKADIRKGINKILSPGNDIFNVVIKLMEQLEPAQQSIESSSQENMLVDFEASQSTSSLPNKLDDLGIEDPVFDVEDEEVTEDINISDIEEEEEEEQNTELEVPTAESSLSSLTQNVLIETPEEPAEYSEYIVVSQSTTRDVLYPVKAITEGSGPTATTRRQVLLDKERVVDHEQVYDPALNSRFIFRDKDHPKLVHEDYRDEEDPRKCSKDVEIKNLAFAETPGGRKKFEEWLQRMSSRKLLPEEIETCRKEIEAKLKTYLIALSKGESHEGLEKAMVDILKASQLRNEDQALAGQYGIKATKKMAYDRDFPVQPLNFFCGVPVLPNELEAHAERAGDVGYDYALDVKQPKDQQTGQGKNPDQKETTLTIWPHGGGDMSQYFNAPIVWNTKKKEYAYQENRINGAFFDIQIELTNNRKEPQTVIMPSSMVFGKLRPGQEIRFSYGDDYPKDFETHIERNKKGKDAETVPSLLDRQVLLHRKLQSGVFTKADAANAEKMNMPVFTDWDEVDLMAIRKQMEKVPGETTVELNVVSDETRENVRGMPFRVATNGSILFHRGDPSNWMNSKRVVAVTEEQMNRFNKKSYDQIVAELSPNAEVKPQWRGMNIEKKPVAKATDDAKVQDIAEGSKGSTIRRSRI